jgi:phage-related baseplate assembly protein
MTPLPDPQVIEPIKFEDILAARVAKAVDIFEEGGIDYDVGHLETDPVKIQLEENAHREVDIRARINDAAKANILGFAKKADLDHLAGFHDVVRMPGEDDARLKTRVRLAIQGRSTGGTEPRYKGIALAADLRVKDVSIYTIGRNPTINVAVFSTDNNGIADAGLVAKVATALNDPASRMANDTIVVAPAARIVVNITADVWLLPTAGDDVVTRIEPAVRAAWSSEMALGRDLTADWQIAAMRIPGVQKVTGDFVDVLATFREAVAIGTITITNRGRGF